MNLSASTMRDIGVWRERRKFPLPTIYVCLGLFFVAQRGFLLWGEGSTTFFAYILFLAAMIFSFTRLKGSLPGLGPLALYLPILFIVGMSFIAIFHGDDGFGSGIMYFVILVILFGLYYFARVKGDSLLKVFPFIVGIFGSAVVIDGLFNLSKGTTWAARSGGIIENVDTAGLLLGLSIFFLKGKWQWLSLLALTGIFFTGCYWILSGIVIAYIFSRFKSNYLEFIFPLLFALLVVLALVTPYGRTVWQIDKLGSHVDSVVGISESPYEYSDKAIKADNALHNRVLQYERVLEDFTLEGHGFNPSRTKEIEEKGDAWRSAHSTFFLLLNQLGPFAVLAWLIATFYVVWKSRLVRYAMLAIIPCMLIGVNDFWLWNCLMPYYFVMLGVAAWDIERNKEKEVVCLED